jgi:hypothetical protein
MLRHVPRAMGLIEPAPPKRLAGRPPYATVGPVPAYKHRPPMSGDTPVWRYLALSAVSATIKTWHLRLTRIDRFQDPFEGSVPKTQIDDQIPLFIGAASGRTMMNCVAAHYPDMIQGSAAKRGASNFKTMDVRRYHSVDILRGCIVRDFDIIDMLQKCRKYE